MNDTITLNPVAVVKNRFKTNTHFEEIRAETAKLIFKPEFVPGLMGLEVGMDLLILFYFNQTSPEEISLQLHPYHNPEIPLTGVFATRSQFRPNSIGTSVACIEMIEDNIITVIGLDALDETPVLDIKPYVPRFDIDRHSQQFEIRRVDSLSEARQAIDIIDAEIIRLFGNRAGYVHQVANIKKTVAEVAAPSRYAEVMKIRREMAESVGLNPDVIEGMYKLLVDNFIKEEIEIIKRREEQN